MRIYKNDIIKASAISTGADRGVLLCSITDSFTQGQKSHEFPNGLRLGNKE